MQPNPFLLKLIQNLYFGKNSPKLWATSVIFEKLPKDNNRPLGENSPTVATLLRTGHGSDKPM
jgi:hypothetical protein